MHGAAARVCCRYARSFVRDDRHIAAALVAGHDVLREELGDTFYVTISSEKCLSAYSTDNWKVMSDKVNAMPYVKQKKMRPLFAFAARCELDGQGRILLPQNLREFAGLSKSVTVVGSNNHAEFWDSELWNETYPAETLPENIAAVMEELDF